MQKTEKTKKNLTSKRNICWYIKFDKANVDKLDIDKLETTLNELSNEVDTNFVKRLYLINWLKKVMLLVLLIKANSLKKLNTTKKN